MYGPAGGKAYTVSVLDILMEAGLAAKPEEQTSLEFYKQQMGCFLYQRKNNHRTNNSVRPDSANDRDIRGLGYQKSEDIFRARYSVPTANKYETLNC